MPIENDVHVHEILHMIDAARPPLTRAALHEAVLRAWGPDCRFRTCSTARLTFDEVLEFITSRGKVVESDGALVIDRDHVC